MDAGETRKKLAEAGEEFATLLQHGRLEIEFYQSKKAWGEKLRRRYPERHPAA
jgi:hypothetical protein